MINQINTGMARSAGNASTTTATRRASVARRVATATAIATKLSAAAPTKRLHHAVANPADQSDPPRTTNRKVAVRRHPSEALENLISVSIGAASLREETAAAVNLRLQAR